MVKMLNLSKNRTISYVTRKFGLKQAIPITALLAVIPILLVLGAETIQRGSFEEAWDWALNQPSLFWLNALLYLCALTLVYCVIGSLVPSVAVTALLFGLMSLISFFKTKLIGEPFFPWDLLLNKEGLNIAPLITGQAAMLRIGIVLGVVVLLFALRLVVPRLSLPWLPRIALGSLSVIALYAFGINAAWAETMQYKAGASEILWNQQQNYGHNGLTLAFTMNVKHSIVAKPPGYGEQAMADIAHAITEKRTASASAAPAAATDAGADAVKPNVIFIMNEAFWDPTLLPDVFFHDDPIPTVRKLQAESVSGYMLSPQFGGGTSNVEFEVLTGQSMSFLPSGSVPYQQYVKKPVPSLASYFEHLGYKSLAVHSYEGWFWDRENAYRQMGFESFMSSESFAEPELNGPFIADAEVSRQIIKQVDESERPMFIYAVTMQNHGPYDDKRYGDAAMDIEGDLTDEALDILQTYAIGARDADQSLQQLIDHFGQSDEPTVIVMYGDHLPMLGYSYDVYNQGGLIRTDRSENWTLEELKQMRSVPFVMWANFELPADNVPAISASFLGSYVMDTLGLEKPAPFAVNWDVYSEIPGLLRNLVVDTEQNLYNSPPDYVQEELDRYRMLQYDLLFGKKFAADYIDADYLNKPVHPDYNREFQKPAA